MGYQKISKNLLAPEISLQGTVVRDFASASN